VLPDGSLPIDADADTFQILLNYMRSNTVYPLLLNKETRFDYALYNRVMADADFFGLHDLRDWIRDKRYEKAMRTGQRLEYHSGRLDSMQRYLQSDYTAKYSDPGVEQELLKCFEAKIPSIGDYLCPMKHDWCVTCISAV
jgi:hypothetical protein